MQQGGYIPWESGEEPGGKLFRRPAELFAGQSSSEKPGLWPARLSSTAGNNL